MVSDHTDASSVPSGCFLHVGLSGFSDDEISSEIPILPTPQLNSYSAAADDEIPAAETRVAIADTGFSDGGNFLSRTAVVVLDADIGAEFAPKTGCGGGGMLGAPKKEFVKCSAPVCLEPLSCQSLTFDVDHRRENLSADVDTSENGLLLPKFTWEELEAIFTSDRTEVWFPTDVDRDPPFHGFADDPPYCSLSDICDVVLGTGDRLSTASRDGEHGCSNAAAVPNSIDATAGLLWSPVKPAVEQVDDEIQFNHASPWKERGIVAECGAGEHCGGSHGGIEWRRRRVVDVVTGFECARPQRSRQEEHGLRSKQECIDSDADSRHSRLGELETSGSANVENADCRKPCCPRRSAKPRKRRRRRASVFSCKRRRRSKSAKSTTSQSHVVEH